MKLQVETRIGPHGDLEPRAFLLGAHALAVEQIIDRWLAPDYGYFKVEASDRCIYILRHDVPSDELTFILVMRTRCAGSRRRAAEC